MIFDATYDKAYVNHFSRGEFILGFKVLSPSSKRSLRNKHLVHVFNVIAFSVFFSHMLKNSFIARCYALGKVKVLENVLSGIICSFAVNNLIKFVAILQPDVCIISGRHICAPQRSTNMASPQ